MSEAQKQRPHELLWMLWFDEKSIFNKLTSFKQYRLLISLFRNKHTYVLNVTYAYQFHKPSQEYYVNTV